MNASLGSFPSLLPIFVIFASLSSHIPALCGLHCALLAWSFSVGLAWAIYPFGSKNSYFGSLLAHPSQASHWLGLQTPRAWPKNTNTPSPHSNQLQFSCNHFITLNKFFAPLSSRITKMTNGDGKRFHKFGL